MCLLVNKKKKVLLALNILDKLTHKVLIIIDDKGRLAGTITDGDIRRSIIRKENKLYCESIMNSNCIYANNENAIMSYNSWTKYKAILKTLSALLLIYLLFDFQKFLSEKSSLIDDF